ncbi:MAG TPA: SDR family oxidoreductase [Verrucomicrobiae bacterium]|nr:SDR family oxidoreductase [Verrucomicrobiae bacterium]
MAHTELKQAARKAHPKEIHSKPPFREQKQKFPGREEQMQRHPDHGEQSYRGLGRLTGKTALITGGDSGIGRAVAIAFAREGANIVVSYLPEEEADAQETKHWVEQAGRKGITMPGDIRNERHCQNLIEGVFKEQGRLDILVNNAAYQMSYGSIEEISDEEWDRTFRTNIFSMFYLCRAAVPQMKPGSTIINTASIQAYEPNPSLLPYAATKAAIVNFTKGLAKMVLKKGIRVNAVAPGPVWTPLIPSTMPEEKTEKFGANTLYGRPAQPAEIAPLYVFLASGESSYVTGEVYGATGGKTPT